MPVDSVAATGTRVIVCGVVAAAIEAIIWASKIIANFPSFVYHQKYSSVLFDFWLMLIVTLVFFFLRFTFVHFNVQKVTAASFRSSRFCDLEGNIFVVHLRELP